jgi:parallel beta-helix repeat protein
VFRYNGKHGMILAVGCARAVVSGNESYGNRGHGIVVFQGSDDALVRDNLVHHNGASGLDVSGSARTRVTGNTVYANADGISAHDRAVDVTVLGNRLTANRGDGLRLVGGTRTAVVQDNVIDHNFRAGALVSGDGVVLGPRNQLTENETGVWLDDHLDGSTVIGNRIADNVLDGMHLVGESAAVVRGNTITGNRKAAFSVLAAGAAGGLVHGNTVGAHQALERVRAAETPGGLRKGAVGQALEDE